MNDPRRRQAGFNSESRGQWDGFAGHRRAVSALLGAGRGRLCVLGAGNANDLDLPALLGSYREVHLVDLDAEAMALGAARQGVADRPGLVRHGGIDVTAMLDVLAGWSPARPVAPDDLRALAEWPARRVGLALPGPFEVVASTCLLSQVVGNAAVALGGRHPRFLDAVRAIRLGHLRLLAGLTAAGGEAVLVTDVISSERCPGLESTPASALPLLLDRLARDRGLIHGVHPGDLLGALRDDPVLARRAAGVEAVPPWTWRLHARTYLVLAIRWRSA